MFVDPATATGAGKPLLDKIKGAFGTPPNMFRAVANSPRCLEKHVGSVRGAWGGNDRRRAYCLAAHTLFGKNAGASGQDMADAHAGHSNDPKTAAALAFALKLVERREEVADARPCAQRASATVKSSRLSPMSRLTCSPITST
jgi:hypothetical protein